MKNIKAITAGLMIMALPLACMTSCSDSYMEDVNTDKTKPSDINPNAQLTTGLLQTYGDFGLMDAYRCYVTGFTQHFSGGWNVCNYAGAVNADNDMMRTIWDEYYNVAIKNMVDAISRTEDQPNLNAMLRIHRAYIMAVLTDTYGDVPCSEAGYGYLKHIANPKYDTQEDIYYWIFDELETCISQLGGSDKVTGDVTAYNGDAAKWKKYANSLRMRYAMRISDVDPVKAKTEFEKALAAPCGYISSFEDNAYIRYMDSPFTLYDGARDLDFRANALGEMLYGQDASSPTFICATFFEMMKANGDPRLYRICRHYNNIKRSAASADDAGNLDFTDEVIAYQNSPAGVKQIDGGYTYACIPGAAWYSAPKKVVEGDVLLSKWVQIEDADIATYIPRLAQLIADDPNGGYKTDNYHNRMLRPALSIKLEKAECPGVLMTNAEVEFLLAEAKMLGWGVDGEVAEHYEAGIRGAMKMLCTYYDVTPITDDEINLYIQNNPVGTTAEQQKERINTEAWILHTMNPAEAWANMRRSDYPVLIDRNKYEVTDFISDDTNMTTPVRLKYPSLEAKYNSENYQKALDRMDGIDDWHHRVWWDTADNTHLK